MEVRILIPRGGGGGGRGGSLASCAHVSPFGFHGPYCLLQHLPPPPVLALAVLWLLTISLRMLLRCIDLPSLSCLSAMMNLFVHIRPSFIQRRKALFERRRWYVVQQ